MNDNWIYIGADINNPHWSKVGKTTRGLTSRHTSSQCPGYFIFTAYNIIRGNVHDIEKRLLAYIESQCCFGRISHTSTGRKSECFSLHPNETATLVEWFIENNYASPVTYGPFGEISRYQCDDLVYKLYSRHQNPDDNLSLWNEDKLTMPEINLNMSCDKYFAGNRTVYEQDLGNGHFVDLISGLQGYRDEDGNEYFD